MATSHGNCLVCDYEVNVDEVRKARNVIKKVLRLVDNCDITSQRDDDAIRLAVNILNGIIENCENPDHD